MPATPIVSRKEAIKQRTRHQFVPGLGYLVHSGPPELPPTARGTKNCAPPAGAKDGGVYMLRPPNGAPPMEMVWHGVERAWGPTRADKGNRMAWTPDHLSKAGWEYVGPKA